MDFKRALISLSPRGSQSSKVLTFSFETEGHAAHVLIVVPSLIAWRPEPVRGSSIRRSFRNIMYFCRVGLLTPRPTPNLEDQVLFFVWTLPGIPARHG